VAALAVPAVLLAGCASADKPASSGKTSTQEVPSALKAVKVTGDPGKKPTVKLGQTPTVLAFTGTVVLKEGEGAVIQKGQRVSVDYLLVNGKDGKEADSSFGKQPASFVADPAQTLPGLANSLIGQKVGSRLLSGITARDGFGASGNSELGFTKDDALIFVLDVKSASTPLKKAEGEAVAPPAGLPTVKDGASGPTITMVAGAKAPTTTVAVPLIKGKGPKVTAGQHVTVNYLGQIFNSTKVFDSSFSRGTPQDFVVGTGQTIAGFDKGLVGQTVGSRMLLLIPPAEGYGAKGNSQAGIKPTDSLVFVVDILDAY